MSESLEFFWSVAQPFLAQPGVEKGTMMGYPCLRSNGDFFASVHPESGSLIIKASAETVQQLISDGSGEAFAPNGRIFREWVVIPDQNLAAWTQFLETARAFVKGSN